MLTEHLARNDIDQCLRATTIKRAERLIQKNKSRSSSQLTRQNSNGKSQSQGQRELVGGATGEGGLGKIFTGGGFPDAQRERPTADTSLFLLCIELDIVITTVGKQRENVLHVV